MKEFLKLVNFSEADGHLQQKLKQLLKLSKEKWEAACEHAKTAVQVCTLRNSTGRWHELLVISKAKARISRYSALAIAEKASLLILIQTEPLSDCM